MLLGQSGGGKEGGVGRKEVKKDGWEEVRKEGGMGGKAGKKKRKNGGITGGSKNGMSLR